MKFLTVNLFLLLIALAPVSQAVAEGIAQVQNKEISATPTPAPTPIPAVVGQNPGPAAPAAAPAAAQPSQIQLPEQPKTADSFQLPPGFPATPDRNASQGHEKFVGSEVVAVLPPVAKSAEIRAVLRTSVGDITLKLDRVNAPLTVANFVGLARGDKEFIDVKTSKPVKRPFYNGLTFHRVVKGTLIQSGDPFGNGRGDAGPIAQIPDEIKPSMKFAKAGLVAMAPMRDATGMQLVKNSNGSQFFITLRPMPEWNNQFTVFAEVEDGMDVVQKIANSKVGPTERPSKRIFLVAVEIIDN